MNWRRIFLPWLAALLIFAQHGAFAHALSHLAEHGPAQQEKHLPHSATCERCVEYAGVGSAVASSPLAVPSFTLSLDVAAEPFASFARPVLPAYHSRAPPVLV